MEFLILSIRIICITIVLISVFLCGFCLVIQFCLTLRDSMDCSLPGSSVHVIFPGKNTGVGCHFLLQGIFLTQGLNPGLLHCRQILYHLSHQGSPQFSSVTQLCLTLCDTMDCSTPGFPVLHYLLEFVQTHWASLVVRMAKNPSAMRETWV